MFLVCSCNVNVSQWNSHSSDLKLVEGILDKRDEKEAFKPQRLGTNTQGKSSK